MQLLHVHTDPRLRCPASWPVSAEFPNYPNTLSVPLYYVPMRHQYPAQRPVYLVRRRADPVLLVGLDQPHSSHQCLIQWKLQRERLEEKKDMAKRDKKEKRYHDDWFSFVPKGPSKSPPKIAPAAVFSYTTLRVFVCYVSSMSRSKFLSCKAIDRLFLDRHVE